MTTTTKTCPTLTKAARSILNELEVDVDVERWGWLLLSDGNTWWAAWVTVIEAATQAVADPTRYDLGAPEDVRYKAFIDAMDDAGYDADVGDYVDTIARLYMAAHGMTDGQTWGDSDLPGDADYTQQVWIGDGPETATAATLCRWHDDPDGTGILLYGECWDYVNWWACEAGGIWLDDEVGAVADEAASEGWTIQRGSYTGTTDDRLGRWYAEREDADSVDRRGPGHATIQDAVDSIEADDG